jgi:hypothetical protein
VNDQGKAVVKLPAFKPAGTETLTVKYLGTEEVAPSETTLEVKVLKAGPRMNVDKPGKVHAKKARPRLAIALAAPGQTVRGKVTIIRHGRVVARGTLKNGRIVFRLPAFKATGPKMFTVRYLGSNLAKKVSKKVTIKVVR